MISGKISSSLFRSLSGNLCLFILLFFMPVTLTGNGKYGHTVSLSRGQMPGSDTSAVNSLARKVINYDNKKVDIKQVKAIIDSAETICNKENIEITPVLHLARAEYFFQTEDFNNASQEASIALKSAVKNGEQKVRLRALFFLGRYSLRTGFFKESIDYYRECIDLAGKEHLNSFHLLGYRALANVYYTMGKTRDYNKILSQLIKKSIDAKDTLFLKTAYYLLGTSFTGENRNYRKPDSLENKENRVPDSLVFRDFRKADSLLRKSLAISLKQHDTSSISITYANLGWNYYREKKYDSSIREYQKSLTYSLPRKIHSFSANAYGNLGTIYRDMGLTDSSLKNYHKSIEEATLGNDVFSLYWVYLDMSDMYLQKKDTAKAFNTYVLYKKYSDLYLKKTNSQGLAEAKIRYDAETHAKELQLLSLRVSNQRLLIYGYTGLFILSIAIGILLFSRSKINSKRRISEMNRRIAEVTQANLRQQMNPHFIFNTLNSIQYYMYQHDKLATNTYLTKFSSLMRKVLENSQHTSVPLCDELEALNLYLELERIRFKDKFDFEIIVDEEIDPILYKVPTMLIQPYVENSISHGLIPLENKGMVRITLKLEQDYISCTIMDNGIGREAAQDLKNKQENIHNSLGTQIVSSRLDLFNTLYGSSLKTIYTDLKNEKGDPEGTLVEIQIPLIT